MKDKSWPVNPKIIGCYHQKNVPIYYRDPVTCEAKAHGLPLPKQFILSKLCAKASKHCKNNFG